MELTMDNVIPLQIPDEPPVQKSTFPSGSSEDIPFSMSS